jgi:hypothetical protein
VTRWLDGARKGLLIRRDRSLVAPRRLFRDLCQVDDGDRLCDLLRDFWLGIEVGQRAEEDVSGGPGFYEYEREPGGRAYGSSLDSRVANN